MMTTVKSTTRIYKRRSPILNNRDAVKAKPEDKPYQRKLPDAPGAVLRIQPNGKKFWKLIQHGKPRTLGHFPVLTYSMAVEKALAILRGEDPDATPEPEPEEPEVLTFGLFLERHYEPYLEANHSRPAESLGCLKRFGFDDTPLEDLRLVDVETWRLGRQKQNRNPKTINRDTATLKATLQKAVEWELLKDNPLARLKPLKIDKRPVVRYLTDEEDKRLQTALKARDKRRRDERKSGNEWRKQRGYKLKPDLGGYSDNLTPMILLALNTGLRRGELWNLVWSDVDFKRKNLTVHGKGAKSKQTRHIPLNDMACTTLKTHKGDVTPLPSMPVFGQHEFRKALTAILKNAKIDNFRFHDCRHTFASRLVMAGVPLNTVRELMGHASLEMTLIYAHLAPDNLRHAVEMLP